MGNLQDSTESLEALKNTDALRVNTEKLGAMKALKQEIIDKKPSNILSLIVSAKYQEALSNRITEFVDNDETIIEALELLHLLSINQFNLLPT
jgi:hypothetical protein